MKHSGTKFYPIVVTKGVYPTLAPARLLPVAMVNKHPSFRDGS